MLFAGAFLSEYVERACLNSIDEFFISSLGPLFYSRLVREAKGVRIFYSFSGG